MPKAILEFDLNDHEDKLAHRRAVKATDASFALFELDQWLRNKIKHEDRSEFQEVRDQLHDTLAYYDVDLE